jgi:hypothetical protein
MVVHGWLLTAGVVYGIMGGVVCVVFDLLWIDDFFI